MLWLLGGFALLLGAVREPALGLIPRPRELPREDGATGQPWFTGGFVSPVLPQVITQGRLPPGIAGVSSWVGNDSWQGRAESAWFKASRAILHVGIAGYPQAQGCNVWAEFRDATGRITRVRCLLPDPREQWEVWEIRRPSGAVAARVIAEDATSAYAGWVAVSHPFRAWSAHPEL